MNWRRFAEYRSSQHFEVRMNCAIKDGVVKFYNPGTEHSDALEFSLWEMNCSTWEMLESECLEMEEGVKGRSVGKDEGRMKVLYIQCMFRGWNLEEPLTFDEHGVLDDESLEKVLRLHPAILDKVADTMYNYTLSQEDEAVLAKQSTLLFGKSKSVSNPHPMISLYCTLSEMWQKFGLNYFDLMKMPLYEKNALRMIGKIESQMMAQEMERASAQTKGRR